MARFSRALSVAVIVLVWSWPAVAVRGPSPEQTRQFLKDVAVHIDIETPNVLEVCTGWIGWTETGRSAVYTAAHCYQPGATYRLALSTGEVVTASGFARWNDVDLMALWIPRGPLRAIRAWKPMPTGGFYALYVLNGDGTTLAVTETRIAHLFPDIVFINAPSAVAMPISVLPGTSGAPILDQADGLLVGMIVGHIPDRRDISAVIPASRIYKALLDAAKVK